MPEDPATCSANGALGAYLVRHALTSSALRRALPVTEPTTHIISEQGVEINRPSTLYVEVDSRADEITTVRVGGQVVSWPRGSYGFSQHLIQRTQMRLWETNPLHEITLVRGEGCTLGVREGQEAQALS